MFLCTDCNLSFNKPQHYSNHLHSRNHALNRIETLTRNNDLASLQNINPTVTMVEKIGIPVNNSINMENQQHIANYLESDSESNSEYNESESIISEDNDDNNDNEYINQTTILFKDHSKPFPNEAL
ncbi:unnamed protein product [Rhizophagus irregularis]|uniref:C2H2-type domain-containing protein n=1 Tax=Rhizophagus irregularis TaxID=588596 RepID=A0A916DYV4_9GLOM|nr:unnamed protein product [Rhizophagus irregularis]